jgi:hypothetical protein
MTPFFGSIPRYDVATLAMSFLDLCRPGLLALRRYWKPFLLIEACGLAVVILYFKNNAVRQAADAIAAYKAAGGLPFAAAASALSGAIIPEIGKAVALGDVRITRKRIDDVTIHLVLFAGMGILADLFYSFLARLIGDEPTVGRIAGKMAIDQLLYSPFLTLPLIALIFTCRRCGWSLFRTAAELSTQWYLRRVVTLLLPCWCFWVPMTALMYSLPPSLTFCFAMFAQGAWCLLMVFVAQHEHVDPAPRVSEQGVSERPIPCLRRVAFALPNFLRAHFRRL